MRAVRLPLDVSLAFVVIVPDLTLSTARARQALPSEVSRESAAFNLSRMALLIAGLADSRVLISEATEDRLHQDYRSPLFPAAPKLLAGMAARRCPRRVLVGIGALAAGDLPGDRGHRVQEVASAALAEADIPGQVLVLHPDMHGLIVDRDGTADVYDFNAERLAPTDSGTADAQ